MSTTGTGAESTTVCVLDVLSLKVKTGISHVRLRPVLAVVDPELRLRGLGSLRVIDSSIMPRIVSGSTQSPSMMIGEMGASLILDGR